MKGENREDRKPWERKRKRKLGKGKVFKIGFWNVAGINNKDEDFRKKLREWDVMFLSETWLQRKGWDRVREWLPKGYVWEMQDADRKNKKGRAMGGNDHGNKERDR